MNGEFNSDDHYIYCCEQDTLRRNRVALKHQSLKCSTWVQSQKQQDNFSLCPNKLLNIIVIEVYTPTTNAEEDERFNKDLKDLDLILKKKKMPVELTLF